jgi:predicted aldo/keto reductase-like oxidoreductase
MVAGMSNLSPATGGGMPKRTLGHTGEQVSMLGVGGYHLGRPSEDEAIRMVRTALDHGMNFLDNCWDYNGGESEVRMGKALRDGYRQKAFLMTKIDGRTAKAARQQLEQSLQRLQTDHIDLLQFHEVIRMNDPERIFAPGGGMEEIVKARSEGKVRYIGFTGHKSPAIHAKMLDKPFAWDTVQMPNNVMDSGFLSFRQEAMPIALKKNIGIIGMKGCCGDGRILKAGLVTVEQAYRYCLSQPVSVQVVGLSSVDELKEAIRIARGFKPLTATEVAALQSKIKDVQSDGRYELCTTSMRDDSAYHRTQHGFATGGI